MANEKEDELTLVFGTEGLLESAKEPFIGEVIYAEYPCHCEDCEKGATGLASAYGREAPDRLHIKMKPLTVYDKIQHQWWIPTKTKLSRWGALQAKLEELGLIDKFKTDREQAFMNIVAEWEWTEVAVGVTGDEKFHWTPKRILTEDEVAKLKSGEASEGKGEIEGEGEGETKLD